MSLSLFTPNSEADEIYHQLGHAAGLLEKVGGDAAVVYKLTGRLYLSRSGWLLLGVPNAVGRGFFDALGIVGAELPLNSSGTYNAHISVMSPDEVESLGGASKITERGHDFHYTTGPVKEVAPGTWEGVSKVWYVTVESPELRNLRKSYGLDPYHKGHDFHITFAIKRTGIDRHNDVSKVTSRFDVEQGRERSLTQLKTAADEQWQDGAIEAYTQKLAAAQDELAEALEAARTATETNPTEAQKESGNYAKGRLNFYGLPLSLENPKGSIRRGVDKDGNPWQTEMKDDYGYIRRTVSEADGDHVDVFIGPDLASYMVYVVDQQDPATGKFDEHKCVLGCRTKALAEQVYRRNYSSDWKGFAGIKSMHLNDFKEWLETGDTGNRVAS